MLRLTLKETLKLPLEVPNLKPDVIVESSNIKDVGLLPAYCGNEEGCLGDFFDISGEIGANLQLEGDLKKVKRIGEGMSLGCIEVIGDVGMYLGKEMKGGSIIVHGNVSDWLGMDMSGGTIWVKGNAGNFVCASYWGEKRGASGGAVFIEGSAGDDVGRRMRRGTIFIGGDSGNFTGVDMIAGNIFVMGKVGVSPGAGMKWGTIVLKNSAELLPSFYYSGEFEPAFLLLYMKYFREAFAAERLIKPLEHKIFRRYMGDFVSLGKGEILMCLD